MHCNIRNNECLLVPLIKYVKKAEITCFPEKTFKKRLECVSVGSQFRSSIVFFFLKSRISKTHKTLLAFLPQAIKLSQQYRLHYTKLKKKVREKKLNSEYVILNLMKMNEFFFTF